MQHVVSFTKTLVWINMLIEIRQFFPSSWQTWSFWLKVIKRTGNFFSQAPDSEGCFPSTPLNWPLKASNKVDRSQLVWYEPIPGSAKKGRGVLSKMPTLMISPPNWSDKTSRNRNFSGGGFEWILQHIFFFWPCYLLGWWTLHRLDFSRFCGNHPQLLGARLRGFVLGV